MHLENATPDGAAVTGAAAALDPALVAPSVATAPGRGAPPPHPASRTSNASFGRSNDSIAAEPTTTTDTGSDSPSCTQSSPRPMPNSTRKRDRPAASESKSRSRL
jgi:hypothetical protein